ncbi:MAG: hypothetical protein AB7T49_07760 [Oligoflexales bacterium]
MKSKGIICALGALALISCGQREQKGGEGSGSSGSDGIRSVFIEARQFAVEAMYATDFGLLEETTSKLVSDWTEQQKDEIVEDIITSKHVWSDKKATKCAETNRTSKADIILSFERCKESTDTIERAAFVLIHESVHHFGIADEDFADQVAFGIIKSSYPEAEVEKDAAATEVKAESTSIVFFEKSFEGLTAAQFIPFPNETRGTCYYPTQEFQYTPEINAFTSKKTSNNSCDPYVDVIVKEGNLESQYFEKVKVSKTATGYDIFIASYEAWPYTQETCPIVDMKVEVTGYCGGGEVARTDSQTEETSAEEETSDDASSGS